MTTISAQQERFTKWWTAQGKQVGWQPEGCPCGTPGVSKAWDQWVKLDGWNAESVEKPGAKVRTYRLNPDGSIGVLDVLREEVEGHV